MLHPARTERFEVSPRYSSFDEGRGHGAAAGPRRKDHCLIGEGVLLGTTGADQYGCCH